jgi:DNA-binding IclR family transcriptional regulator
VRWEDVLAVLATADAPLSVREVTERSGIQHRQDAHRRLERLRERGAVVKLEKEGNVYWAITDLGRQAYRQIFGEK